MSEDNVTTNSGVCVKSVKSIDGAKKDFYGILKKVIEVSLVGFPILIITLFKCDWFDRTSRAAKNTR